MSLAGKAGKVGIISFILCVHIAVSVIVNTNNGRVQGDLENGYRIFRGIPYGESTAPPNRYQNS
jgi:hypothetical protein